VIRLQVFGTLRVDGDPAADPSSLLEQPTATALLLYLTLASPRGFHQRDRVVGMFWPESDQAHARKALRNVLARLCDAVGDDVIDRRGKEAIAVRAEALWCDAIAFERALEADRLREALDLYQGDVQPISGLTNAREFERWLDERNAHYRERAVNAAWDLVERYAADSQLTNASQLARVVARLASNDERILRRVMTMLWRLGDRAGAIDVYTRFADRLWEDYETRPSAETLQLVARIRAGAPIGV
jgi:serine/threonine-protein kinase